MQSSRLRPVPFVCHRTSINDVQELRPSITQRSTRRLRALANGPLNRPFPIGDINACAFFTAKRPDAAWHREQLQLDLDVGGPEDSGWPPGDNYHFAALSPGLRHKGGQATRSEEHTS